MSKLFNHMHDSDYKYPIKTADFKAFGHAAQLRMFRKQGEENSYYFTISFPYISDKEESGFILENGLVSSASYEYKEPVLYDVFLLEEIPELIIGQSVEVSCIYESSSNPLKTIYLKIKGTPVNGTASFWPRLGFGHLG